MALAGSIRAPLGTCSSFDIEVTLKMEKTFLYFGNIGSFGKEHENISLLILYAELNPGSYKNGEPGEYLRYFLYYP